MPAYYNEIDPFAAEWLRQLIKKGMIADGEVDERSITDVEATDLFGFTQCHFFAGIGVWSYALRQAGWSDDRPVWTGSAPCQPFSVAGKGKGFADERHLFPTWLDLIQERKPPIIFGEQVASKAGIGWFDSIQPQLEGEGYACGMVVFPACSVGAPHLRKRMYWIAENQLANANGSTIRLQPGSGAREKGEIESEGNQWEWSRPNPGNRSANGNMADTNKEGWGWGLSRGKDAEWENQHRHPRCNSATNGFWGDPEWIYCKDGKYRPIEPSISPLVDGLVGRVGRLRGYGNAIVAPQAQALIEAYMEAHHAMEI